MDPYRPPQSDMQLSQKGTPIGEDPFFGAPWEVGTAVSAAMEKVKADPGPFFIIVAIFAGFSIASGMAGQLITFGAQATGDQDLILVASLATNLLSQLVGLFVSILTIGGAIKIGRGEKFGVADLVPPASVVLSVVAGGIMVTIGYIFGLMVLIVPGVIWILATFFTKYIIIDQHLGPIDAIKESLRLTDGNKMKLLIWCFAVFGMMLLGVFAMCIGALLVVPFTQVATAMIYDNIRRQHGEIA